MSRWLECSPLVLKVSGSKHNLCAGFFKTPLGYRAVNGYLALIRAGEGQGGEVEERRHIIVTPSPVQVVSLAATSPQGHYGLWEQPSLDWIIVLYLWSL